MQLARRSHPPDSLMFNSIMDAFAESQHINVATHKRQSKQPHRQILFKSAHFTGQRRTNARQESIAKCNYRNWNQYRTGGDFHLSRLLRDDLSYPFQAHIVCEWVRVSMCSGRANTVDHAVAKAMPVIAVGVTGKHIISHIIRKCRWYV